MKLYSRYIKRFLDIILSGFALLCLSPIIIFLWIWLTFANKGAGALFFQERPGKDEKIFKVVKFKTMTDERDENRNLLSDEERLTKVGKFVRSTSLDELPQLWNVLKVEEYVRSTSRINKTLNIQEIIRAKSAEASETKERIRIALADNLKSCEVIIGGEKQIINAKEPVQREREAIEKLVINKYSKKVR